MNYKELSKVVDCAKVKDSNVEDTRALEEKAWQAFKAKVESDEFLSPVVEIVLDNKYVPGIGYAYVDFGSVADFFDSLESPEGLPEEYLDVYEKYKSGDLEAYADRWNPGTDEIESRLFEVAETFGLTNPNEIGAAPEYDMFSFEFNPTINDCVTK